MWIFTSNSFLSIVAHTDKPDTLLVRSRLPGDIEALFPDARVFELADADYRYRAEIPRNQVAEALADSVRSLDYPNFKNSLSGTKRKSAAAKVWQALAETYGAYGRPPLREP